MTYTGVDDLFGDYLVQCGFERMGQPGVYRATYRGNDAPGGQNVFISLGVTEDLNVMCPIGLAEDIQSADLDVARDANDRCEIIMVGSYGAFTRPLNLGEFAAEGSVLVDRAIELAQYTAQVKGRLEQNRAQKAEVLQQLQEWSNDYKSISFGRVTPGQYVGAVAEALTLVPKQGLLDEILKDAMNENLRHWTTSGVNMSDSPWHEIVQRLEGLKQEYGWVSKVEPDLFEQSGAGAQESSESTASGGAIWNTILQIVGSVDREGRVWNPYTQIVGTVDTDGAVWSSPVLVKVASVDRDGTIWASPVIEKLGSVESNGDVWNTTLQKVGSAERRVTVQQAGAAAVLLGLL